MGKNIIRRAINDETSSVIIFEKNPDNIIQVYNCSEKCRPGKEKQIIKEELIKQINNQIKSSNNTINNKQEIELICPISYETLETSKLILVPCGHIFNPDVLLTLLNTNKECPICRNTNYQGLGDIVDIERSHTIINSTNNLSLIHI